MNTGNGNIHTYIIFRYCVYYPNRNIQTNILSTSSCKYAIIHVKLVLGTTTIKLLEIGQILKVSEKK